MGLMGLVGLVGLAPPGCHSSPALSRIDGAAVGSMVGQSAPTDASSSDRPEPCKTARTCVQNAVVACTDGLPGALFETCADHCSRGRCVSADCAQIETSDAARGCLFYGLRPDNIDSDVGRPTMLLVTSDSDVDTSITVESRASDGSWAAFTTGVLPARGAQRLSFSAPAAVTGAGTTVAGAFRVVTDHPTLVVELSSDDLDRKSRSSAGTVLRPWQALGLQHFAMTFPQRTSDDVAGTPGSQAGAGLVAVVATQDATTLTVTPMANAVVGAGGQQAFPEDGPFTVSLDEGDVFQLFSAAEGDDLTGTSVASNHPVAVFSGNVYSTYGDPVTGFNGGDLALEQLPPVESWSNQYVGAGLSPQANCDPFAPPVGGRWSVVAASDGTDVSIATAAGVTLAGVTPQFRLDRGESMAFSLQAAPVSGPDPGAGGDAAPAASTDGPDGGGGAGGMGGGGGGGGGGGSSGGATPLDFVISAALDKPILLAQWLDCEPALSLGIDTRHGSDGLDLVLPPGFDHELLVVRERKAEVTLNGTPLASGFTSAGGDGRFEVRRVSQAELGPCRDLLDSCFVSIGGGALGVSWRGMDVVCSYAVTVPPWNAPCALPGQICPE
jgi:hypothetical protein